MRTRKPNRLQNYDYSRSNYYMVTIDVDNRERKLGTIENGKMILNISGRICLSVWNGLPSHYHNLTLDEFIIMPNHIHGILYLNGGCKRANFKREGYKPSPTDKNYSLTEIIRGFKTFSSKEINRRTGIDGLFKWQRSFHDHIIRDRRSLETMRQYIIDNPANWSVGEGL